jgi:hypothetical protein
MQRLLNKARAMLVLVRNGKFKEAWQEVRLWLYSDSLSYGLRRDLTVPFEPPDARLPIHVRPLTAADVPAVFQAHHPDSSDVDDYLIANRHNFYQQQVPTCYVAVTEDDEPTYIQWLISNENNPAIQRFFGNIFPILKTQEALLEFAFTLPGFRGQRIMPNAMAQIAARGADIGARWVITFVGQDNIPALKGCKRSGFWPYLERHERWRFFRRQVTFTPLPEGTPYPFDA